MKVPVANIYYLLCYAWDKLDESELVDVHAEDSHDLLDLLTRVLCNGTRHLLRRGVDRGYIVQEDAVPGMRGKFMPAATIKQDLLTTARTWCRFDELSPDVVHNRILKATLRRLSRHSSLNRQLREEVRDVLARLPPIEDIALAPSHFRTVQLHRNNAFYDFLLRVCRIIFDNLMVEQRTGTARFRDFVQDEVEMRLLFQSFAFNFYRREQADFAVSAPHIDWHGFDRQDAAAATLPTMQTDIVLRRPGQTIIIDTKFTARAFQTHFDTVRARSAHLYQIFAYVSNFAAAHPDEQVDGMLLYPVADEAFGEVYKLTHHSLSVQSIDLRKPWRRIADDMLALLPAPERHLMPATG